MAIFVVTALFVILGIGVLFVAMSGGPGGARKRLASQSRGTRRLALVNFVLAVLILGLGIPAAVIATVGSRDDIPEANVTDLTEAEKEGRRIFGQRCANCHSLKAANAVAQVGPNLDNLRPPKNLVLDAINKGRARGNGQMAAGLVEGEQAQDVASFVAKAVGQSGGGRAPAGGG
jgi:mono/diheme cytochrome c family protein